MMLLRAATVVVAMAAWLPTVAGIEGGHSPAAAVARDSTSGGHNGDLVLPARFAMAATSIPSWGYQHQLQLPPPPPPAVDVATATTAGLSLPSTVEGGRHGVKPRFDMSPYVGAE